jgi:predicted nucleotidyltransferase component of viral defense system
MINRQAIEQRVREWGLREDVVEKDYVLGWVLWGIGQHPTLSVSWAFKGGTSLKKCYLETYRFSEDLDFTVLPGGPIRQDDLEPIFRELLQQIADASGINFSGRPPLFKTHSSGHYTEGRLYYQGPRNAPQVASIRLDLSASERIVRPTVLRSITHAFPDVLPEPRTIRCYSFEEVFAEKLRAMGERSRPRDLYDIVNLYRRSDLRSQPQLIRTVLQEKCESKGVPLPTAVTIMLDDLREQTKAEWSNMLAHQLQALPPFEHFWEELPALFNWLDGTSPITGLAALPLGADEESAEQWSPPPTVWTWGAGVPLETIRFAAANYLCVTLGYQNTKRVIEPYSLRRTRDGHLILHAVKVDSREPRSYRVDRIESVEVTTRPFKPVFLVEFSGSGPIAAPATTTTTAGRSRRATRHGGSYRLYIIECSYCGKKFRRTTPGTSLKPHKDKSGYACSGRAGYLVDTQ